VHVPHWQLPAHVSVPPFPHGWVAFGAQTPSPRHDDHEDHVPASHVRVWNPQLPHDRESGPMHVGAEHAAHWQLPPQVCVPPVPHAWVVFGAQTPSPEQDDHADQVPLSQVRV
jgi:hypothetical protein